MACREWATLPLPTSLSSSTRSGGMLSEAARVGPDARRRFGGQSLAKRKWQETVHKLSPHHNWKAKPGYNIFVADMGALRFDIPEGWVVVPGETSYKLHDRRPPDDECVVEVTANYLPPADFSDFPLETALADVLKDS